MPGTASSHPICLSLRGCFPGGVTDPGLGAASAGGGGRRGGREGSLPSWQRQVQGAPAGQLGASQPSSSAVGVAGKQRSRNRPGSSRREDGWLGRQMGKQRECQGEGCSRQGVDKCGSARPAGLLPEPAPCSSSGGSGGLFPEALGWRLGSGGHSSRVENRRTFLPWDLWETKQRKAAALVILFC